MAEAVWARPGAGRAGVAGWLLFDWAAQPFFTLVTTFVFAPYFAAALAPNPVEGQALWGYAAAVSGLAIAFFSPVLGAVADASGYRKRWIAVFSVMLLAGCAMLWFAAPGVETAIAIALIGFILASIGAEFAGVFVNAMMPGLVPAAKLGRLSGNGWAMGYAGGLVSLVIVLGFLAASPETGRTLLGVEPLFGLDGSADAREGDRAAGPFSALWFIMFATPLFLFTPDMAGGARLSQAVRQGLSALKDTLAHLPRTSGAIPYLIAHMLYIDGLAALFAFGGIFAAGTFGWSTIEIGIFGIFLTITGTFGAVVGGRLDDRIGPRAVIAIGLVVLLAVSVTILSISADRIGFLFTVASPQPGDGLFATLPEQLFLALGGVIGAVVGPIQAASRTLLVAIAPPDRMTQFFGLKSLSGKATSFIGPLAVALVTDISGSQKAGIAVLLVLFAGGLIILRFVPDRRVGHS